MEFLVRNISLMFIVISCIYGTNGFATKECPHDYLISQLSHTFRCLNKINNMYIDEFNKTSKHRIENENNKINESKMCHISKSALKKQFLCVNTLIETCFDEYYLRVSMRTLFSSASQSLKPYEEWKCNTSSIAVNKLFVQMQQNLVDFWENMNRTISSYQCQNKRYLMSIIKFDKQCSYEEKGNSLLDGPFACFLKQSQELRMAVDLYKYNVQESLPFCNTMEKILRLCFNSTECFSQREMNSIRQISSTYISMVMENISRMSRHVGGFSKLFEVTLTIPTFKRYNKTRFNSAYGHRYPNQGTLDVGRIQQKKTTQMYGTIINLAIRNYETGNCREILNEFSLSSGRQTSQEIIKMLYLSLNMFIIITI